MNIWGNKKKITKSRSHERVEVSFMWSLVELLFSKAENGLF